MKWNVDKIGFLHQPEYFLGTFDIPQMQERHEKELEKSLNDLKTSLDNEADPLKALQLLHRKDHIQFLLNNIEEFRQNDRLEETVIALYTRNNGPFSSGGNHMLWERFFNECDRAELRKLGKPFPAHIKKVFRGSVSGFMRSLAWTPDMNLVGKFADRWKDPARGGGELYEVEISQQDILVYMLIKHEEIMFLSPEFIRTAEIRPYQP